MIHNVKIKLQINAFKNAKKITIMLGPFIYKVPEKSKTYTQVLNLLEKLLIIVENKRDLRERW